MNVQAKLNRVNEDYVANKLRRAAELKRVYVCHPYSNDPAGNVIKVERFVRAFATVQEELRKREKLSEHERVVLIAPHLAFPPALESDNKYLEDYAVESCISTVSACHAVLILGYTISAGMALEIKLAQMLGLTIIELADLVVSSHEVLRVCRLVHDGS